MPTIDELPTKLAPLAKLTAIEIGARQFETDIARLLDDKDLALLLEEKRQQTGDDLVRLLHNSAQKKR